MSGSPLNRQPETDAIWAETKRPVPGGVSASVKAGAPAAAPLSSPRTYAVPAVRQVAAATPPVTAAASRTRALRADAEATGRAAGVPAPGDALWGWAVPGRVA